MQIESGSKVSLNTKAIEEAQKWDGLHGVITNALDLSVKEVLRQYKGLWQVAGGRIFPHNETRPKSQAYFLLDTKKNSGPFGHCLYGLHLCEAFGISYSNTTG